MNVRGIYRKVLSYEEKRANKKNLIILTRL
jgi:hypothetical protein